MDRLLPRQFIVLVHDWFAKCVACVRWGNAFFFWYQIGAGVRQGGILSPILFAVYMDPLTQLRHLRLGCSLHGGYLVRKRVEIFGYSCVSCSL